MWCICTGNKNEPVEGACGGFESMYEKALDALRNGLEDSYWYGDDDEKVINELVRKAEAFDEIKDYLSRPSPIDEDRYEIQKIIDEYDKEEK